MIRKLILLLGRIILRRRYKIRITGLDAIRAKGRKGIIFLPNHPALIDPVIIATHISGQFFPEILADRDRVELPVLGTIFRMLNVVPMSDAAALGAKVKDEVQATIRGCAEYVAGGGNLLLYPAGHLYRSRFEFLGGNSSVETILSIAPHARIVLIRTRGLWGSSLGWGSGEAPDLGAAAVRGIKGVIKSFIFFAPKREVNIEFVEPEDFPRTAGRNLQNRYLEAFYNENAPQNTYVPYSIWEKGEIRVVPEPERTHYYGSVDDIPEATKKLIMDHLREMTGLSLIGETDGLARELGIDSIMKVELISWIEDEFGFSIPDPEALQTVGDILLASTGAGSGGSLSKLAPIPDAWFTEVPDNNPLEGPRGETITEIFTRNAVKYRSRVMVADQSRGVITYGNAATAIMVLKPIIEKIEGDYVGLMFPALAVTPLIYLSTLFAGKIPVMINWTVGSRSIKHSLAHLGVKKVITSKQFLEKIESQGTDLSEIRDLFLFLEDATASVSTVTKLSALVRSKFGLGRLRKARVKDIAVVLFTSGSEALPKAVPLTHENILDNVRGTYRAFNLTQNDRMLGVLPPFHSFGLTVTTLIPILGPFKVVYHPNPTEGRLLARLIGAYRVTILVGTPTFLEGITRNAEDHEIRTLRLVVCGAEKCPDRLYNSVEKRWPSMTILEGYGITECSPIVSANRETKSRRGTIGIPLDSVEWVIRDIDSGERVKQGEPGMLLLRGKSVFGGYIGYDGPSPFTEFEGKQWYVSGDIVREDADGILVFTGRLKRFVKIGGEMISLPAIEEVLLAKYQSEDADPVLAVESTPVETNPEIVLFTTAEISREDANLTIREAGLSPIHNIRIVKKVDEIPLLGTGKTNYRMLKQSLV